MRWNFGFTTADVDGDSTINISYNALVKTFAPAVGNGADRASLATNFTIEVSDLTNGGVSPFTWPLSPTVGDGRLYLRRLILRLQAKLRRIVLSLRVQ